MNCTLDWQLISRPGFTRNLSLSVTFGADPANEGSIKFQGIKSFHTVEKIIRALRQAQHERKFITDFKTSSVRSESKGERSVFHSLFCVDIQVLTLAGLKSTSMTTAASSGKAEIDSSAAGRP
jgi:hypothetical protein